LVVDRRADDPHGRAVARLLLIIGPVGAGKSTLARALGEQHRAVRLILDEWMARLYGADERPASGRIEWYLERRDRCREQIWRVASAVVMAGTSVVLEPGLIRRDEREAFYDRVDAAGLVLAVHLIDAPRELRRARVLRRNVEQGDTFSQVVPLEFFELASDLWEPPDRRERDERGIHEHTPGPA
jgi:predicted kinase